MNHRQDSHLVEVLRLGILDLRVPEGHQGDDAIAHQRIIDEPDGRGALDDQWNHIGGEHHCVP